MEWIYHDGGRAQAGYRGEASGDCVTRAAAIVTGLPYREVAKLVNKLCRLDRSHSLKGYRRSASRGVGKATTDRVMEALGLTWVPVMKVGPGKRLHMRAGEVPEGRIVVRLSGHVAAVLDGVVYDNHDPRRGGTRLIYGYWRSGITPIDTEPGTAA